MFVVTDTLGQFTKHAAETGVGVMVEVGVGVTFGVGVRVMVVVGVGVDCGSMLISNNLK